MFRVAVFDPLLELFDFFLVVIVHIGFRKLFDPLLIVFVFSVDKILRPFLTFVEEIRLTLRALFFPFVALVNFIGFEFTVHGIAMFLMDLIHFVFAFRALQILFIFLEQMFVKLLIDIRHTLFRTVHLRLIFLVGAAVRRLLVFVFRNVLFEIFHPLFTAVDFVCHAFVTF